MEKTVNEEKWSKEVRIEGRATGCTKLRTARDKWKTE